MRHNYWSCTLEPTGHNYWGPRAQSPCSTTREAIAMRSPCTATKSSPRLPELEKAHVQQWRPKSRKGGREGGREEGRKERKKSGNKREVLKESQSDSYEDNLKYNVSKLELEVTSLWDKNFKNKNRCHCANWTCENLDILKDEVKTRDSLTTKREECS